MAFLSYVNPSHHITGFSINYLVIGHLIQSGIYY